MNYEKFTLVELRQLAKEKGTKNVSKLKKDELIKLLEDTGSMGERELEIQNDVPSMGLSNNKNVINM